jgi:hypothetical protein
VGGGRIFGIELEEHSDREIRMRARAGMVRSFVWMALSAAALSTPVWPMGGVAQQPVAPAPPSVSDPTAPNVAPAQPMTKSQMKEQRRQQKLEQKSAKAQAKSASDASKAKDADDKAVNSQEKAGAAAAAADKSGGPPPPQ